jgi:phosphatidylglycerol phospholipase C
VHFSLFQPALVGPLGARFRRLARERGRQVFAWTVNDEAWMEWCVRKGLAGVITDEVGRFEEVRRGFGGGEGGDGDGGDGDDTGGESSGVDGDVDGKVGDGEGKGKEVVVVRNGIGWPRWVRLYFKAGLLQAVAMLASVLLWRRLSSRGGGTKKGRVVEGVVPGKV